MSTREKLLELDYRYTERLCLPDRSKGLRKLAGFLAHSGDSWFLLSGLALIWLLGSPFWKLRAALMIVGILLTALVVFIIKFIVRRQRPEGEWGAIYRKTDPLSFPSGHAARAVMLAILALSVGPLWFSVLLAVWAPLVVLARVMLGVHYFSDVLVGAILGIGLGLVITRFYPLG
jgi:undecaprenyl-diphosphatase